MKFQEVAKKVVQGRFPPTAIDSDNNALQRFTMVKIKDRNDPLRGQLGEVKALHRNVLFIWVKNSLLVKTNGIYAIDSKKVINAGAQHMKEANELAGLVPYDNQANPDRQKTDRLLRSQVVLITKGTLKGYRGSVISANETFAEVHVHSKCAKFAI